MKLKTIVTFLYLCISLLAFLSLDCEPEVWISFSLSFIVITSIAYYHLNIENNFSPFLTSFAIFNYLFFFIAPIFQISSINDFNPTFENDLVYSTSSVIITNFLIIVFNIIFFFSYLYFRQRKQAMAESIKFEANSNYNTPLVVLAILFFSFIILYINYDYIINNIFESVYAVSKESTSSLLLRKKFLFFVPLGGVVVAFNYLKRKGKININTVVIFISFIIFLALLFFFKNIFTEKRNTLGPIYITLIYLFFPKWLNSNAKFFLFLFLSMVVAFPLLSTLTHIDASLNQIVENPILIYESFIRFGSISGAFESLHYDAFSNIMATIEYVSANGVTWGYQFLGVCLFFVPRSFWTTKPISSGELIGDYLMETTPRTFTNLSNAIVSEGYINLGFLGVIFMAIILAYFIVKFMQWHRSGDYLKEFIAFYFAIHLIFLLRGDLTNGFSYFVGPLLSVYFLPKILIKTLK